MLGCICICICAARAGKRRLALLLILPMSHCFLLFSFCLPGLVQSTCAVIRTSGFELFAPCSVPCAGSYFLPWVPGTQTGKRDFNVSGMSQPLEAAVSLKSPDSICTSTPYSVQVPQIAHRIPSSGPDTKEEKIEERREKRKKEDKTGGVAGVAQLLQGKAQAQDIPQAPPVVRNNRPGPGPDSCPPAYRSPYRPLNPPLEPQSPGGLEGSRGFKGVWCYFTVRTASVSNLCPTRAVLMLVAATPSDSAAQATY
jgi:hypothetical protein